MQCSKCKEEHPLEAFKWRNKAKQIRHGQCDACRRMTARASYEKHKSSVIEAVQRRNKQTFERFQTYKSTLQCAFCGEATPCCLDFHHKDPTSKDFTISDMVSSVGWDTLMAEINKCVVACANCHRKVHADLICIISP